jgi:hypothetical protein
MLTTKTAASPRSPLRSKSIRYNHHIQHVPLPNHCIPFDDVRWPQRRDHASDQAVDLRCVNDLGRTVSSGSEPVLDNSGFGDVAKVGEGGDDGEDKGVDVRVVRVGPVGQVPQERGIDDDELLGASKANYLPVNVDPSATVPAPVGYL